MAKKKKLTEPIETFGDAPNVNVEVKIIQREFIPCPVRGHTGQIEIEHTENRSYAICHCPGKHRFYGQIVWEKN